MNAAKYRHRCLIERKQVTQDPIYGTETITWATLATVWCEVQDVLPSRSEAVKQGLAIATNQSRIRMRFRTDIDSSMRFTINRPAATVYNIISGYAEIGNKNEIEFVVEKATS